MFRKHTRCVLGGLWVLAVMLPVAHAQHWILLGTAHVDKSEDHKTIHVGNEAGSFHKINCA